MLPDQGPGLAFDAILDDWPDAGKPRRQALTDVLALGTGRLWWRKEGQGKRGDPYTYWRPADSVSVPTLLGNDTDTETGADPAGGALSRVRCVGDSPGVLNSVGY
jgi:hypothetical protein